MRPCRDTGEKFHGIGFEFLPRTASVPESATGQRRSHVIGRDGNVGGHPSSTAVRAGPCDSPAVNHLSMSPSWHARLQSLGLALADAEAHSVSGMPTHAQTASEWRQIGQPAGFTGFVEVQLGPPTVHARGHHVGLDVDDADEQFLTILVRATDGFGSDGLGSSGFGAGSLDEGLVDGDVWTAGS